MAKTNDGPESEIMDLGQAEEKIQSALSYADAIMKIVRHPLVVLDENLRVISANKAFYRTFQTTSEETQGQLLRDLGDREWDILELNELLKRVLDEQSEVNDVQLELFFKTMGKKTLLINADHVIRDGQTLVLFAVEDITERVAAELEVVRSKEEWERTFDAVPDLIMILDNEHRIQRANKAMANALGVAPQQAIGMICYEAVHALDFPPTWCPHSKLIADGHGHREVVEEPRLAAVLDVAVVPIHDSDGRTVGSVHVAHDITELKRTEEKLRDSEARLRTAWETSPDAFTISRLDNGVYVDLNQGFVELSGYTREEAIGKSSLDLGIWENPRDRRVLASELQKHGRVRNFATRLSSKNGEFREVLISAGLMELDGELHLFALTKDVEQLRRAETALRESEQRFRAVFDNAPLGIDIVDRSGRFVEVNSALADMLGYTSEELCGLSFYDISHPDHLQQSREHHEALVRGDLRSYRLEKQYIKKNGGVIWADVAVAAIYDSKGEYEASIGVISDITERKRIERQLQISLKEKEVLLKEIHHRVKNNLALVCSLVTLQASFVEDKAYRDMLQDFEGRVRSIAIAHEKLYQSENLACIDVPEYINGLVDHLMTTAAVGSPIFIDKDIDDVSLGIETAIPVGFIVSELVSNCVKHAFPDGRGGLITVTLHSIGEQEFELIVRDNGCGISEDVHPENPESLGMELLSAFTEKLKGNIEINSNQGTQVRVRFKEI